VTLTCIGALAPAGTGWPRSRAKTCWGERSYTSARAERLQRADIAKQLFVCKPCRTKEMGSRAAYARLWRFGYRPTSWREMWSMNIQHMRKTNDSVRAMLAARPVQLIEASRAGLRGPRGPAVSRAAMARTWRGEPGWTVRECQWCGRLLMQQRAALESPTSSQKGLTHGTCWQEVRALPGYLDWRAARRAAFRSGRSRLEVDEALGAVPPPLRRASGPGRPRTETTLTRNFGWTVRWLLGGESQVEIADTDEVARSSVVMAIQEVLRLLPDPDRLDVHFRRYVLALREGMAEREQESA
jgi:hypothetical protein